MRIDAIETRGFGKLSGRTLLSPGLNLVHGDNEAGKSTMLAALLVGLVGQPRGRGRSARPFDRYRPWDAPSGDPFRVKLTMSLEDGSRLELLQDLGEPARSRVIDLDLGRDRTSELLVDRAPDASLLLELDRAVIARTLVVRQSDLAAVRDEPAAMHSMLQRAATRGAPDATANEAITRIEAFRRERVGTEHASSTKPLKRAIEAERSARRACEEARQTTESLRDLAERARRMNDEAARLRGECQRARLAARIRERDELADRLASLDRLEAQLMSLPPLETDTDPTYDDQTPGDLEPVPEVQHAERRAALTAEMLSRHEATRPPSPSDPGVAATPHALRALAEVLEVALPSQPNVAPVPVVQVGPWPYVLFVLAGVMVGLGIGLGVWVLVGACALLAMAAAWWVHRRRRRRELQAHANAEVEASWRRHRADLAHDQSRRESARRELIAAGVEPDPASARAAARSLELHTDQLRAWRSWSAEAARLDAAVRETQTQLESLLGERGACSYPEYVQACATRREHDERVRRRHETDERRSALVSNARALLRGQTREVLERRLETLTSELEPYDQTDPSDPSDPERLESDAAEYERTAARLQGELVASRGRAPSIAEAEEALARAKVELDRLRRLDRALDLAMDHLRQARDAVHRDIAPRLAAALSEVVPRLTLGRYQAARVGADTLEVSVRDADGQWRPASLLSQGTADQLYLALRVILAQTLCKPDEPPPLLFDEVTAHADPARRSEIIEWLSELSLKHQVIVFSSDPAVAAELIGLGAAETRLVPLDDGGARDRQFPESTILRGAA